MVTDKLRGMFSVVIPTMQKSDMLIPLLELYSAHPLVDEVLLVNNSNFPLAYYPAKVREVYLGPNLYVNPAWNLGASEARSEYLLVSNDDLLFAPTLIDFVAGVVTRDDVGIVGPHISTLTRKRPGQFRARMAGQPLRGFGTLMFMKRRDYQVIPSEMQIMGGDDWLFWNQKHRNMVILGASIDTPMSVTAGQPQFSPVRQADLEWWASQWESISGSRDWHRQAFRKNVPRNVHVSLKHRFPSAANLLHRLRTAR